MHIRLLIAHLEKLAEMNGDLDVRIAPPDESLFTWDIGMVDSPEGLNQLGAPSFTITCLVIGRKIPLGED